MNDLATNENLELIKSKNLKTNAFPGNSEPSVLCPATKQANVTPTRLSQRSNARKYA